MKIDRIEQTVCIKNINVNNKFNNKNYTIYPKGNNRAILKTNPGKTINNQINLGTLPSTAELINKEIIENLDVEFINYNKIEYCLDIKTPFKLIDNKHLINIFYQALLFFKYKCGKLDFNMNNKKSIRFAEWKGIKGYKNSRTIKLYSKIAEKNLISNFDIIRLELTFGKRTILQNKIEVISDIEKAKNEILELIEYCENNHLKKINRYSKNTKKAILQFKENLVNNTL